jgi:hypothetical protein
VTVLRGGYGIQESSDRNEDIHLTRVEPLFYSPPPLLLIPPSSQFASGNVVLSTMLDSLLCQQFYNTDLISLLQRMLHAGGLGGLGGMGGMGGKGGGGGANGKDGEEEGGGDDSAASYTQNGRLVQMSVPTAYRGLTYQVRERNGVSLLSVCRLLYSVLVCDLT